MMAVHIRPRDPSDDERTIEIRNAIHHDRAPTTLEEYRHWLASVAPEQSPQLIVAERSGRVVAFARWNRRVYSTEGDAFWFEIMVDPDEWGRGIGTALYESQLPRIRELGARKVVSVVRDDLPRAEEFAHRRGFERTGYGDRISRLDVGSANLEKCRAAARRALENGIRIVSLAETDRSDGLLHAIYEVDITSSRDIPSSTEWKPMPYEEWESFMLRAPGMSPETFWVAMDGDRPIALAVLQMRAGNIADNAYTGVHPAYRGRGVARALKLRSVEWAADHGIIAIITGNDPSNKPMLAINVDLGYKPLPANLEMVKAV